MPVGDGVTVATDDIVYLISSNPCPTWVLVGLVQCNSNLAPLSQADSTVKAPEGVPRKST